MRIKLFGAVVAGLGMSLLLAAIATSAPNIVALAQAPEETNLQQTEFTDHECLDCHTSETQLKELAAEPEPAEESLSSGPG